MPLLFVVKRSRRPLFLALRRLLERPGVVAVVLERRQDERRRPRVIDFESGHAVALRQPLNGDSARTWAERGFIVVKVDALPAGGPARLRPRRRAAPRPARPARARAAAHRAR
jgi:hypothetical protein